MARRRRLMSEGLRSLVTHTAIGVCALMAVVNVMLYKRRGVSAYVLATAFVALGFTLWLYESDYPRGWWYAGVVVTIALLLVDVMVRSATLPKQDCRR